MITSLQHKVQYLEQKVQSLEAGNIQGTLNHIQNNGVRIGSRWKILQEGDVIIIRDLQAEGDGRFAGYPNSYRDWWLMSEFGLKISNKVLFYLFGDKWIWVIRLKYLIL